MRRESLLPGPSTATCIGGQEGQAGKVGFSGALCAAEAFGFREFEVRIDLALEFGGKGFAGLGGGFMSVVAGMVHIGTDAAQQARSFRGQHETIDSITTGNLLNGRKWVMSVGRHATSTEILVCHIHDAMLAFNMNHMGDPLFLDGWTHIVYRTGRGVAPRPSKGQIRWVYDVHRSTLWAFGARWKEVKLHLHLCGHDVHGAT
jgi:hypothetical protein